MRPAIEEGYVFIAQPPLYRAKKGTSIQYLKDELQLEDFLINEGTKNLVLEIPNAKNKFKAISGVELLNIINLARKAKKLIIPLTRRIDNQKVIEHLSFTPGVYIITNKNKILLARNKLFPQGMFSALALKRS